MGSTLAKLEQSGSALGAPNGGIIRIDLDAEFLNSIRRGQEGHLSTRRDVGHSVQLIIVGPMNGGTIRSGRGVMPPQVRDILVLILLHDARRNHAEPYVLSCLFLTAADP